MKEILIKTVVWKEGKHYVALCLNTNVSSFGNSQNEALKSLQEALELYFEDVPTSKMSKVEDPDIVQLTVKHA